MALTFPLTLAQFFGSLSVREASFDLPDTRATTRTRGGEQISAELGARLWRGVYDLSDAYHADADAVRARLALLGRADASFFIAPAHRAGPIADPAGAILGAANPTIHTIAANRCELRITGLPAGYVLQTGDYLSFAYGTSPVRYAFHQIVVGGTANGSGLTPLLEVVPHIRPGAVTGAAVQLVRPQFKAVAVSTQSGSLRPLLTGGMSIEFVQTLR